MTEINAAYLEFRYSGGASNTNPEASIGGAISNTKVTRFNAKYYSLGSNTGVNNSTAVTSSGPFQIIDANGFELTDSNKVPYIGDTVNKTYIGLKVRDGVMGLFSTKVTQQLGTASSNIDFVSAAMPWTMHPAPVIVEGTGKYILRFVSTKTIDGFQEYMPGHTFKHFEVLQLRHGEGITEDDLKSSTRKIVQPPYASQDCDLYRVKEITKYSVFEDEVILNISSYMSLATCSVIQNGLPINHGFSTGDVVTIRQAVAVNGPLPSIYGVKKITVTSPTEFTYSYTEKSIDLLNSLYVNSRDSGRLFYDLFDAEAEISGWQNNSEMPHELAQADAVTVLPVSATWVAINPMQGTEYARFSSNFDVSYISETRARIVSKDVNDSCYRPFIISISLQGFSAICHVLSGSSINYFNEQFAATNQKYFNGIISGGSIVPHGFTTGDTIEVKIPIVQSSTVDGALTVKPDPNNDFVSTQLICSSTPESFVSRASREVSITVIDATTFSFPLLIQG